MNLRNRYLDEHRNQSHFPNHLDTLDVIEKRSVTGFKFTVIELVLVRDRGHVLQPYAGKIFGLWLNEKDVGRTDTLRPRLIYNLNRIASMSDYFFALKNNPFLFKPLQNLWMRTPPL